MKNWLSASVLDPDLQGAIKKARAEFAGSSETQVKALWKDFERMLNTWRAQGEGYAPIFRSDFRMHGKRRIWVGRGQGDIKPDYVETFLQLANQRYVLLPRFIRSLHRNVRLGLVKAFALLILREAADGNPAGALRASNLFDKVFVELRLAIEDDLRVRGSKLPGLKLAMESKKDLVANRDACRRRQAQARIESGEQSGSVEIDLARDHGLNSCQIRRILKGS